MTSTLTLYYDTKLHHNKNFIIDNITAFLGTKSFVIIQDFQYQRYDINKRIKLDLSQTFQGNANNIHKWDYCMIKSGDDTYYYFINGYRQVSQNTIELELEMDVLNTYNFVTSSTNINKEYFLSPKSLITREHKDRLFKKTFNYLGEFVGGSKNQSYTPAPFDTTFWTIESIPYEELVGATIVNYSIQLYPDHGSADDLYISRIGLQLSSDGKLSCIVGASGQYVEAFIRAEIHLEYSNTKLLRKIDTFQEGIETYLFKQSEKDLLDKDRYNTYYVIYNSLNNVVQHEESDTSSLYVNPVKIDITSDNSINFVSSSPSRKVLEAQDERIPKIKNRYELITINKDIMSNNAYIEVNGTKYYKSSFVGDEQYFVIKRKNNNDVTFSNVGFCSLGFHPYQDITRSVATNVDAVTFYDINTLRVYNSDDGDEYWRGGDDYIEIASGPSGVVETTNSWNQLDLTNPRLIKAINYPYCPNSWMVGKDEIDNLPSIYQYNSTFETIELINPQENDFDREIYFDSPNPISIYEVTRAYVSDEDRNDIYESKIYHSDFYQAKFVYDSYGFTYQMENIDIDSYFDNFTLDKFIVRYVISANVLSKFMFQFIQYVTFRSTQDYENVLIIDRNNEKALYTNAYINYIKSGGYSYDTKKANSQNAINGITSALSIVGAIASFASTPVSGGIGIAGGIGLAISSASSIIRNIHVAQEQDRAISQKLLQATNQATQVHGSEDIDILKAFSNNKAKMVYYEPSDIMKKALLDLFYYCGYATHEQKIPNVKTRRYFNFVQGEIILDQYTFNEDIADRIKEKWMSGVTFIHKVGTYWDIDQVKENIENSIL